MNELQKNTRKNILRTLSEFSSIEEQIDYKRKVPFVHITNELITRWENEYNLDLKWFSEIWTKEEKEKLNEFNDGLNNILILLPSELPDVPNIHSHQEWIRIVKLAKETIDAIAQVTLD